MADRFELSGARVLLTGATGGLGQAIARGLQAKGAELVLTGRRVEVLDPLAAELGATAYAADLGNLADVERLVEQAGRIDVLVLNAALPGSGAVLDYTPDQIQSAVAVNLLSPALMARRFAAEMLERKHGHIVFIGSLSGKAVTAGTAVYSMTKFGLRGFAHGLRQDLHGTGVGVSIVQPGFVRGAGMFADTGLEPPPGAGTTTPEKVVKGVISAIERDRAEVNVAPVQLRAATQLAGAAPAFSAAVARKIGSDEQAAEFADRQKHKR
jgi:short-subunit dehydrogenase